MTQAELKAEKKAILYIFGGEKAQGAEIVIERLMAINADRFDTHLILSPGIYADNLQAGAKPYRVTTLNDLRKLNRMFTGKLAFYSKALSNYFKIPFRVAQYIRKHHIYIVHCNTLVPAAYTAPLVVWSRVFMPRVKWLWSDHDMRYFSHLENLLAKWCFNLYDRTLLVSSALKNKYQVNSLKLRVLYNGLDLSEFKPDETLRKNFRTKYGFDDAQILIGIAGSINPDKGQLELIKVFKKLTVNTHAVKLVIAGSFAMQFPDYVEIIKREIAGRPDITYIGFTDKTCQFYNGCDIIINNSNDDRSESLGTTIYEAMACEKLVIASATGGTPEIITDKIDGLLFKPEDTNELLGHMVFAIKGYDTLTLMRKAARQKVIEKFNINIMAATYRDIVNSL